MRRIPHFVHARKQEDTRRRCFSKCRRRISVRVNEELNEKL